MSISHKIIQEKLVPNLTKKKLIRSWQLNEKNFELYYDGLHIEAKALTEEGNALITQEKIAGIPKEFLKNAQLLQRFLDDSYITLSKLSNGGYKIYVNNRLRGGGNFLDGVIVGIVPGVFLGVKLANWYMLKVNRNNASLVVGDGVAVQGSSVGGDIARDIAGRDIRLSAEEGAVVHYYRDCDVKMTPSNK